MGSYPDVEGKPADMLPDDTRTRLEFEVDPAAALGASIDRLKAEAAAPVEKPSEPLMPLEDDEVKE